MPFTSFSLHEATTENIKIHPMYYVTLMIGSCIIVADDSVVRANELRAANELMRLIDIRNRKSLKMHDV